MTNETLRMQMLAGVITEGQYKAKLQENTEKESLNEHMIGGIVGIGAINQIPATPKTDYEMAFEHFLGERYQVKPNRERDDIKDINEAEEMIDSKMLKSYIDQMISLADDMEYTPEMVDELENLKNTLSDGSMSKEDALDIMQKTIDITEDDIDAPEALNQAISGDYELGEGKEVTENNTMAAYQIAQDLIADMDLPDEVITNEDLFLDVIKALKDKLYEKAADLFATKAGSSPDEYSMEEGGIYENMLSVNDSVRITAPLDISAETDEGMITQVYPNFNSIPLKDIGYYEVDKEAYDESALNGPWYKVDQDGEEMLYAAEELEKLIQ